MSKRELVDEIKRLDEDLSITARRLNAALYELKVSRAVCYAWKTQALGNNPSNARLIAAAPELLAALQSLTHPMASDEDLSHALAVIAKAKGGDA